MKDTISKEQFIKVTYEILSEEGIQALSIRRLGRETDCNPANIYRYFTGLDELVLYASLKFLDGYLRDAAKCFERISDSIVLHFEVWRCFAEYSFERPEIFNNLFFGRYSDRLDEIIKDYYKTFPDEILKIAKGKEAVFVSGDFNYRDYLMIENCVKDNRLTQEEAKFLNRVCIHLYKGYLKEVLDEGGNSDFGGRKRKVKEFIECLEEIVRKYVK